MPAESQYATHGYALADAEHVMSRVNKFWAKLLELGATETEKKRFGVTIGEFAKLAIVGNTGPVALEQARQALKDDVGAYRAAASLIVFSIDGRDKKAEEALKMKGAFPPNDVALARYVSDLGQRMRSYSAKLAARGFSKERQQELLDASADFKRAYNARGKERGAARAQTLAREALFKELKAMTSYFRRVGRAALRDSMARAEFDRVKLPGAKAAAAPAPAARA